MEASRGCWHVQTGVLQRNRDRDHPSVFNISGGVLPRDIGDLIRYAYVNDPCCFRKHKKSFRDSVLEIVTTALQRRYHLGLLVAVNK
jgi:hypothetical protein